MRLLGMLFLSLFPAGIGLLVSEKIGRCDRETRGMELFLETLSLEIELYLRPQEDIFRHFENRALEDCGFLDDLRKRTESDPGNALKIEVKRILPSLAFSPGEKEAIAEFAENFGVLPADRQVEECRKITSLLAKGKEEKRNKARADAKVARLCGFAAGIGILILFL